MNRVIVSFFALLAAAPLAAQEQTPRVLSLDEALATEWLTILNVP